MTEARPVPPASVPTLTEVVDAPAGMVAPAAATAPVAAAATGDFPTAAASAPVAAPKASTAVRESAPLAVLPSEAELVQRILDDLQQQVDLVVEYRIRERLTPILERAGDTLVREARTELAKSLREVVARAVASEMRRQRGA
jgi:hypothetical protein